MLTHAGQMSHLAHAQLTWDNRVPVSDPMPGIAEGAGKYPDFDLFDIPVDQQNPKFVNFIYLQCCA